MYVHDVTFIYAFHDGEGKLKAELITWWSKTKENLESAYNEFKLLAENNEEKVYAPCYAFRDWYVPYLNHFEEK